MSMRPATDGPFVRTATYVAPPRPPSPATPPPRRRLPRWFWMAIIVIAVSVFGALVWLGVSSVSSALQAWSATPPRPGTLIVAPEESKAAKALSMGQGNAAELAAAEYLAAQPTAYWLTPELDPIGQAGARVLALGDQARRQDAALAVVVYGLPERDCGQHSAGGLNGADYDIWTAEIGSALRSLRDVQKIVILEPDSLALAPQCGNVDDRVDQLRDAIDSLAGPDTWIYVDAGHSNWLEVDEMAALIARVDNGKIRGFATNVSNFNDTYSEFEYAHALSERSGGRLHAIIDTSRNGNGSNGEWCNPYGRAVGEPGGTYGDDVVDTNLWIKPPGESDGRCNGAPGAGVWWPAGAMELVREKIAAH